MRVVLTVTSGIDAGRKLWLETAQTAVVGRGQFVDFDIPGDEQMADSHFALDCTAGGCRLRNLDANHGTLVNGRRLMGCTLADGDRIVAGQTQFTVAIEALATLATSPDTSTVSSPEQLRQGVLEILQNLPKPLFGLLDAARDPMILALLIQSQCPYQSLYEGTQGETLAAVAPYLVQLAPDAPLLPELIQRGWGQSWGVFLTSGQPFAEIRKNFRRFLLVENEAGEEVYFRYYDPRVLRQFLPTCLADEAQQFFGPVDAFFVEDVGGARLLRFLAADHGSQDVVPISAGAAATHN